MSLPTVDQLIAQIQQRIGELPAHGRNSARLCFARRLASGGRTELARQTLTAIDRGPALRLAQEELRKLTVKPESAPDSASPFSHLEALLQQGDMLAAERLVLALPPEFERIAALTMLARAYHTRNEQEHVASCLRRADTLWRLHRGEWWFYPWLGDQLKVLVECGENARAEELLAEMEAAVTAETEPWLQLHGWCGLAQGAAALGRTAQVDNYCAAALAASERRKTRRERYAARQLMISALFSIGRIDQALAIATQGGRRQELEGLLSALRVASRASAVPSSHYTERPSVV
ncbi:MAG: hypothetical protein A2091_01850 [Desulfuromonadales bacterium GWD2_61_12]|nr:MAG: hypothetical protein A2005_06035 [Desulfuromonadales bacterium GWC2_61_20]OGR35724.1 MAG: hypothetical protein A2091_01850 [Desulfuromonadales bacterium GWD2_61_12]HAD04407.1 hypothetical protein [Desulfuromonas sp.]HBT82955.1 hypothetical protein [Desulfuromonas sp.]